MTNLQEIFNPSSIAVIGASRTEGEPGYNILKNLKVSFSGQIFPINPNTTEILGLTCYPSVGNIEAPIDMAILATPENILIQILKECIAKKIKTAIIITDLKEGETKEKVILELKNLSKSIKMIGPNSLGIIIPKKLDMNLFSEKRFKSLIEGNIAILTQSKSIGVNLLNQFSTKAIGISKFISYGNAISINEVELLEYLANDLNSRCIIFYTNSIQNGQVFINTVKKIKKPILCLKGKNKTYSAAFKQAKIIEVQTINELIDYSKILAKQPYLKSKKIAILSTGKGLANIAISEAGNLGFEIPEFSKETKKILKTIFSQSENPLNLSTINSEQLEKAINAILKDKEIQGLVCILLPQIHTLELNFTDMLQDCKIHGKPIAVVMDESQYSQEHSKKLESIGIPVYNTPDQAIKSLNILHLYGK